MSEISASRTSFDCPLLDSITAIRQIHVELRAPTGMMTTASVLASRIELYDFLLSEISAIRSSLAKDIQRTREPPKFKRPL